MTMTIPSNGKDTKIKVISYTKQKGNKLLQYTSTDNKTYEKSTLDLSDYSDMLSSVQTTDMYSDLKNCQKQRNRQRKINRTDSGTAEGRRYCRSSCTTWT